MFQECAAGCNFNLQAEKQKKHVVDCGSNQSSILAQPRREPHSHKVTCKGRQLETISFGGRCAQLPEISFFSLKIQDMSTEALTLLNLTPLQSCCDELNQLGQPHSVVVLLEPKKV